MSPGETNLLAIALLSLMALALAGWIVAAYRRLPFTLVQSSLYGLNYLLARILWRAKVHGTLNIPEDQGGVIVCNHRGSMDPSFLFLASRRVIHWMVAREYVESRAFAWALRKVEVISVNRGGIDTAATKQAIRFAIQGDLVGMFPEGRINDGDQLLLPGRPGAALIALKARVPVIPCYIHGSPYQGTAASPFYTSARVSLTIGEPIDLSAYYDRADDRKVVEQVTKIMLREIARLAGRPDFEPKVIGRSHGKNC